MPVASETGAGAEGLMGRRRVLLDVDTGVDDGLALMLAIRSPELEVLGITTVSGNVPVARSTANTLLVLEMLGASTIPVVAGAAAPLAREPFTAAEVHGSDGLGGVTQQYPAPSSRAGQGAAEFLLETIRRFPGELTLIATGPLTNVATAIQRDAEAMHRLRGVTVMGGAIRVPGNVGPTTEFNFAVDPEAAAIVLGAGLLLTLVPLDVTEQVILSRQDVDEAGDGGPLQGFIRGMTAATMAFHWDHEGFDGMFLHDPLAVGVIVDPSLVRGQAMAVAIECRGELTAGMAVADLRRRSRTAPTATVCVEVEAARFLHLFTQRVLR
ncbi:MAG: nucleoside hydrolase [candidate division NC10 bacterium]|nr:nucleoside hydrolase [candidate division NC10 bacterium]